MPLHLKDLENRVHESCGFANRDNRRVLLPGHILLPLDSFVKFAAYILTGGSHGWGGACPYPDAVKEAVHEIVNLNLDALLDSRAPARKTTATTSGASTRTSSILTDESFYAMFKDKFSKWKPIASDMAKLPEPVRKFITDLQRKEDPEGSVLISTALETENKNLQQQVMDYRQKLLSKDKEAIGLSEYVDEMETNLETSTAQLKSANQRCDNIQTQLDEANALVAELKEQNVRAEQVAQEAENNRAATLERLKNTEETLQVAEKLLNDSEEARLRQDARFRSRATGSTEAAPEVEEEGSGQEAKEPEVPRQGTSDSE